ncbi:hypothetical protein AX16_008434 [Volvariella volvacea WC 439]|nr:hypothetical protein AX16_008434 [Volvariella volvacea WC 439]
MLLGTLFVFLLSRTLAHPVSLPPENPVPPTSPVLTAFVAISDCIRDPSKIRSTSELVWNCLGTIFVCTYVAIHPNMPDRNASSRQKMWQKVKTCLYALLAPEAVIAMAMRQRFLASRIARQYRDYGWTMSHGFFVIMGGLMRKDGSEYKVVTIDGDGDIELGGKILKSGIIFPAISEDEIQDKAKGDFLTKLVVVIQTSWFVIQCIARHAQGLAVTELELITLAFATLNVITYFLWWSKPLNAEFPIYFNKDGSRISGPMKITKDNLGIADRYSGVWIGWAWGQGKPKKSVWERIKEEMEWKSFMGVLLKWLIKKPFVAIFSPLDRMLSSEDTRSPTCVGPYYSGFLPGQEWVTMISLSSLVGVLFGGIHLIGWNFLFSTSIERDLWRASSIIVTVEPAILAVSATLDWLGDEYPRFRVLILIVLRPVGILAGIFGPVLYVPARIALLVLPLFALRDLPPSAHQNVQWSDYIPHI